MTGCAHSIVKRMIGDNTGFHLADVFIGVIKHAECISISGLYLTVAPAYTIFKRIFLKVVVLTFLGKISLFATWRS